jgi:hypothetical protein
MFTFNWSAFSSSPIDVINYITYSNTNNCIALSSINFNAKHGGPEHIKTNIWTIDISFKVCQHQSITTSISYIMSGVPREPRVLATVGNPRTGCSMVVLGRNICECLVYGECYRRVWRYQSGNQNPYIEE